MSELQISNAKFEIDTCVSVVIRELKLITSFGVGVIRWFGLARPISDVLPNQWELICETCMKLYVKSDLDKVRHAIFPFLIERRKHQL